VEALRSFGLLERSLVSSQYVESLDRIRALEPGYDSAGRSLDCGATTRATRATALPAYVALGV
jgi:hypothetical protein